MPAPVFSGSRTTPPYSSTTNAHHLPRGTLNWILDDGEVVHGTLMPLLLEGQFHVLIIVSVTGFVFDNEVVGFPFAVAVVSRIMR
ncbi:uncharacterized protein N7525_010383 [Penicillium rubens]|uniref:uncharacterized protein n=1 Tax=Penicillium rubens TaxID=1108849 RepID=UPI002A5A284C|nr:uncharacterized protein N7525_010383 [Penicillium rubens]KAJ5821099.1 hypothetical protein N7525_010383 [Penicillium rubens]KAJ5858749.1 hypothetical protein N7534_004026 [Penicillium rubens]